MTQRRKNCWENKKLQTFPCSRSLALSLSLYDNNAFVVTFIYKYKRDDDDDSDDDDGKH